MLEHNLLWSSILRISSKELQTSPCNGTNSLAQFLHLQRSTMLCWGPKTFRTCFSLASTRARNRALEMQPQTHPHISFALTCPAAPPMLPVPLEWSAWNQFALVGTTAARRCLKTHQWRYHCRNHGLNARAFLLCRQTALDSIPPSGSFPPRQ